MKNGMVERTISYEHEGKEIIITKLVGIGDAGAFIGCDPKLEGEE